MTVRELMCELMRYDMDLPVCVYESGDECGTFELLELYVSENCNQEILVLQD